MRVKSLLAIPCVCLGLLFVFANTAQSQDTTHLDTNGDDSLFWYNRPETSHYLFAPTAYGPLAGEGSYQNGMVLMNRLEVGFTKNISVSGGLLPVVIFEEFGMPLWLTPKVSVPLIKDKLNVAAGAMMATIVGVDAEDPSSGFLGVGYSVATYGTRDRNISLGAGLGFSDGAFNENPLMMASGTWRFNKLFALLSENYFKIVTDNPSLLLSGGGRVYGKKLAFDFALVTPIDLERNTIVVIPWFSINVPFYNKRMQTN